MTDDSEVLRVRSITCFLCGNYQEGSGHVREHTTGFRTQTLYVCDDCQHKSLCPANPHGIHGEIIDLDELRELQMTSVIDTLPSWLRGVDGNRAGVCEGCQQWFFWFVEEGRSFWGDALEPLD